MPTDICPPQSILAKVCQRLGLAYESEPNGTATLFIDGLRILLIPETKPAPQSPGHSRSAEPPCRIRLLFKLADLPARDQDRETWLMEAVSIAAGNLANMEANHETLTVSENANELLLFWIVTVDQQNVDECLQNLAQFVDAAEYWQRAMRIQPFRVPVHDDRPWIS